MSVQALLHALKTIPHTPGVYRMVSETGKDLYIGKAKDLYKRVLSYTQVSRLSHRLKQMVHHVVDVKTLTTPTELDALLLEANLIKRYQPPYNILLKEGNSFSYLVLTRHPFPRIHKQRIASSNKDQYCFGPFLSSAPLDTLIDFLHKTFLLRSCSDHVFSNRTRPCLQYYIKRCSAPCVNKVDQEGYAHQIDQALRFLKGDKEKLRKELSTSMYALSNHHNYVQAAKVRDQLKALDHIEAGKTSSALDHGDVIVYTNSHTIGCIQLMCFRHGHTYGAESFFFPHTSISDGPDIVSHFLRSFYEQNPPPDRLVLNVLPQDSEDLKLLLRHHFGKVPHFIYPKRGPLFHLVSQCVAQARHALERHCTSHSMQTSLWQQVTDMIGLREVPQRIEIYDNSHHQGDCAVGVMVVAGPEGFIKKEYRTFSMQGHGQDDYAMMRAMMKKRFAKEGAVPDLMIIDGGKGQLSAVREGLAEAKVVGIPMISIAKSDPCDMLYTAEGEPLTLDAHHGVLHLVQRLRDEAHRFAVSTHRRLKQRKMTASAVQTIPGIGPKRYAILMNHFKTIEALKKASHQELCALFSPSIADKIYTALCGGQL